jgi:uncharacterized damage-inducible protein DinB
VNAGAYRLDVEREFQRLKRVAEAAWQQVDSTDLMKSLDGENNSIALIVKHIAGNLLSRWTDFLHTDGEKPDRRRDSEFEIEDADTESSLIAKWEAGWALLLETLRALNDEDLERTIRIRDEPMTVTQALQRQLTHHAYHVGQIVLLARHFAGPEWKSLSIPRGKSAQFNAKPKRYLDSNDKT